VVEAWDERLKGVTRVKACLPFDNEQ